MFKKYVNFQFNNAYVLIVQFSLVFVLGLFQ